MTTCFTTYHRRNKWRVDFIGFPKTIPRITSYKTSNFSEVNMSRPYGTGLDEVVTFRVVRHTPCFTRPYLRPLSIKETFWKTINLRIQDKDLQKCPQCQHHIFGQDCRKAVDKRFHPNLADSCICNCQYPKCHSSNTIKSFINGS